MPKKAGGVTKATRQHKLREVLRRWGSLEKAQIDHYVAQSLDIDPVAIKKPLYDDLTELVREGELLVTYYQPDGARIADYDPEIHKTSKATWSMPQAEGQVTGAGALKLHGAELLVSKVLRNDVRVDQGAKPCEIDRVHLFFNLNAHFFSVRITRQMLPVTFILARETEAFQTARAKISHYFQELEADFGRRLVLLLVPSSGVSSPKPPERLGHLALEIQTPKQATVRDLGSSNGTDFSVISIPDAEALIQDGSVIGTQTITQSWNHQQVPGPNPTACQPHEIHACQLPAVIQASDSFRILVVP